MARLLFALLYTLGHCEGHITIASMPADIDIATLALGGAQTGSPGGNSVCAHWCAANFAHPGVDCTSLAAKGTGPCYTCGPLKTIPSKELCSGACTNTDVDNKNCGACGNEVLNDPCFERYDTGLISTLQCPAGSSCNAGSCICSNSGKGLCDGGCPDLNSDSNNCGSCGHKVGYTASCNTMLPSGWLTGQQCPSGTSCSSGTCKCTNSGQPECNGQCPDYSSDDSNCGSCGNKARTALSLLQLSQLTESCSVLPEALAHQEAASARIPESRHVMANVRIIAPTVRIVDLAATRHVAICIVTKLSADRHCSVHPDSPASQEAVNVRIQACQSAMASVRITTLIAGIVDPAAIRHVVFCHCGKTS